MLKGKFKVSKKVLLSVAVSIFILTGCGSNSQEAVNGNEETNVASSDTVYNLKLGHILTADHPNGQGAEKFAEIVKEKTDGKVIIDVFPSSQLGNEKDLFDAVSLGSVDFAILGFGEPSKRYKPLSILDAPYIADDGEHYLRILNDPIVQDMFDEMTKITDVRAIGPTYFGVRYLSTSKVAGTNPEELNGLKIRTPDQPIFVAAIEAMGGTPVPMAFSEVYLALQQGVLDGFESTPAAYATNKFYEVQKYLINTSHIIGGNCLYVSEKTMATLPQEYQDVIVEAGTEAAEYMSDLMFEAEEGYMDEITSNGVTFIEDVDRDAFIEGTQSLYEDYESDWGEGLLEKIRGIE
ncbi:TRAP transporter substrate-binding protein [Clostridium sp. DL1XJH146]